MVQRNEGGADGRLPVIGGPEEPGCVGAQGRSSRAFNWIPPVPCRPGADNVIAVRVYDADAFLEG